MENVTMDNYTFGLSMLICGMGGTLAILWGLSLIIPVLKMIFPYDPEQDQKKVEDDND